MPTKNPFKKPEPTNAYAKLSLYGPAGSGKTFTGLLFAEGLAKAMGKRVALIDTENGAGFYSQEVASRAIHPDAFDFDIMQTRSVKQALDAVTSLPDEYGVLQIDSITHFWEAAIAAYVENNPGQKNIPMHEWSRIKKPYKALIDRAMSGDFHLIVCGREKSLFEFNERDEMQKVGTSIAAEGQTAYEFHFIGRMFAVLDQAKVQYKKKGGTEIRPADESIYLAIEKDRSGIHQHSVIQSPTFESVLAPILPLLNGEQHRIPSPEATAEQDAALREQAKKKDSEKLKKSAAILAELQALISAAQSLDDLSKAKEAVRKKKRSIVSEHLASLGVLYEAKREQLVDSEVGEL